ncbi:MAG TPA: bifunctional DNA primase/polymerase, partial [Thermaerobacter sp.]
MPDAKAIVQHPQQADTSNLPETLAAALFLHRQGLALLPLRPGGKEPHGRVLTELYGDDSWGHLARRRASEPEVTAWFEKDPGCNIGVIAGQASGGLAFVDVDDIEAAGALVQRLYRLGGPVIVTPRPGLRFLFRQREPIPARKIKLPDGRQVGEILTGHNRNREVSGQYAVMPPSVHPSGRRYFWLSAQRGLSATIPELDAAELDALLRGVVADPPTDAAAADADAEAGPTFGREVSKSKYFDLLTLADRPSELVEQLQRHPTFIEGALRVLGLDGVRIGQVFKCVLPGHDERRPSASLYQLEDGAVVYRDWHGRGECELLTLAEVFAAQRTGHVRKLRGRPEHVVWVWRLAIEAGVIEPAKVEAPAPPADLRPAERKLYESFLLLLACKWRYEPGAPTAFSWRFAAAWAGLSERHAGEAMRELLRRGLIRKVGEHKPARGRPQALFLPGLVARAGGAKDEDKPARPWTRRAVKNVLRAARAQKDKPAEPCAKCGGTRFWRLYARKKGEYPQWICDSCLPA